MGSLVWSPHAPTLKDLLRTPSLRLGLPLVPMAPSSHLCGSFTRGCSVACELGEVRWLKTAPNLPPQVLSRAEARRTS